MTTIIIIIIIIIIKRAPFLRVYSFTLALHLQLVPLCDNFHAFEEVLILQRQTLWSFYQRSTYSIELELWVNQETLRSFYKFSKLKMKTFGDYLGNSFVLGHVADVGYSHSYIIESLRKPQLQWQRERHWTNGLISRTMAVHVRHKFLYISLRPLQNYNVKSLNQLCVV